MSLRRGVGGGIGLEAEHFIFSSGDSGTLEGQARPDEMGRTGPGA